MLFNGVFPFLSISCAKIWYLETPSIYNKGKEKKRRFDDWILEPVGLSAMLLVRKIEIITLHLKRYLEKTLILCKWI